MRQTQRQHPREQETHPVSSAASFCVLTYRSLLLVLFRVGRDHVNSRLIVLGEYSCTMGQQLLSHFEPGGRAYLACYSWDRTGALEAENACFWGRSWGRTADSNDAGP